MMQLKTVQWMELGSGILLIAVILLSLFNPWWQLRIGDFGYASFSPLTTDFSLLGTSLQIPFLTAINISCLFLLSFSAALMIVSSVNPTKAYSKQLLCWSYKQPLMILLTFVVGLVVISPLASFIAKQYAQVDITLPLMGTSVIQVPSELFGEASGVQIGIGVSGAFHWTFFLAIAATVLCIVTRILYGKASSITEPIADATTTSIE